MFNMFPGTKFYYANRETKTVEKCLVIDICFGYPTKILVENLETNKRFFCYVNFGCYDNYDEAFKDAQIDEERIIY